MMNIPLLRRTFKIMKSFQSFFALFPAPFVNRTYPKLHNRQFPLWSLRQWSLEKEMMIQTRGWLNTFCDEWIWAKLWQLDSLWAQLRVTCSFITQDAAGGVIESQLSCPVSNSFRIQWIKRGILSMVISMESCIPLKSPLKMVRFVNLSLIYVLCKCFLKVLENNRITCRQIIVIPQYIWRQ